MKKHFTHHFGEHRIFQIPVLQDNYIYVLARGDEAAVVDPAEAESVNQLLDHYKLNLKFILNTHHHPDHCGGNAQLVERWGCEVMASDYDRDRIPFIKTRLNDRDQINILGAKAQVVYIPGHTLGHIAYFFRDQHWLFSGDTLFSLGCGRLFEGNPQQMQHSLSKIKALPDETMVFCAHEYTEANLKFHLSVYGDDPNISDRQSEIKKLRKAGMPSVPVELAKEKSTNLFLRWNDQGLRKTLGMESAQDWEVFAKIRQLKDEF